MFSTRKEYVIFSPQNVIDQVTMFLHIFCFSKSFKNIVVIN